MAELSKIILPNGNEYTLKDEVARSAVAGGVNFRGVTTTVLMDESTITTYKIDDDTLTAQNGDLVVYNKKEFIYSSADSAWHEMGDNSSFKNLAYSDEASATYTPAGDVSQPEFTGQQGNISVSGTPTGSVRISKGEGTTNYTPEGTISKPNVNVELDVEQAYVASSATGGGTVTPGSAAQCTLPSLEFTVVGENLTIGWTEGSFTTNTPTTVNLPTFSEKTIAKDVKSAGLDATPTFTGTAVDLEATFTGSSMESTGTYTPEGTVSQPTFEGTEATITVQ